MNLKRRHESGRKSQGTKVVPLNQRRGRKRARNIGMIGQRIEKVKRKNINTRKVSLARRRRNIRDAPRQVQALDPVPTPTMKVCQEMSTVQRKARRGQMRGHGHQRGHDFQVKGQGHQWEGQIQNHQWTGRRSLETGVNLSRR